MKKDTFDASIPLPTCALLLDYVEENKRDQITSFKCESESEVAQSCLTLCDPVDCSPPDSSFYEISQARTLEWAVIPFSNKASKKVKIQK